MGGHHSHEAGGAAAAGAGSGASTPRRGSARSGSADAGAAPPEPAPAPRGPAPSLHAVEKLMKWLAQRSQKEDGVHGVTENSFTKYVFPSYPALARALYAHLAEGRRHVAASAARAGAERVLAVMADDAVIELYVRVFAGAGDGGDARVAADALRALLHECYTVAMDHYPDGPQTCLSINKTLQAVVAGCFGSEGTHSVNFVVRWLSEHCHRLILPLHRYVVHVLGTRARSLAAGAGGAPEGGSAEAGAGLELGTPTVDRGPWAGSLLTGSAAWLLAGCLPPLYSRPLQPPRPDSRAWLARLVCAVPSHWTLLYASGTHGHGANRFLHHTTGYRGPTLLLLRAGPLLLALASPQEWRETHQYWGGPDSALVQLSPAYSVLERGPKMLYLNTTIRGYPRGLRAGPDPRRPRLALPIDFDTLSLDDTPYPLDAVEVWGCGDSSSRETQLEIKKWQVKEAERQRCVKLSPADWIEHPDRYLLELAGRPQYNNSGS